MAEALSDEEQAAELLYRVALTDYLPKAVWCGLACKLEARSPLAGNYLRFLVRHHPRKNPTHKGNADPQAVH